MFLRKPGTHLPDYTVSRHRRKQLRVFIDLLKANIPATIHRTMYSTGIEEKPTGRAPYTRICNHVSSRWTMVSVAVASYKPGDGPGTQRIGE
jgi:hypothetical protein